ncbi:hypothetical protein EWM62_13060 [Mucilaginibacter terrigena]|uniref:Uncharacterized protein n=1 Tax=Mucilaginibacter terrigena TaxID=2492395 RepID=A0A4Q5LIW4_9SPHI|nr:hypothetical protein [Mucilaginibacter terrigena]RYU89263.1 hypothetical protein EWM62_13060 [Mucilaginibacter terrigena]
MKKSLLIATLFICVICGCATVQSIVKSTFPYTAAVVIPASAPVGTAQTATSTGNSFDQNFGNTGTRVNDVRIVSAKISAGNPSEFNIGNLASAKIYMSKMNGDEEVMVASRSDIGPNVGNSLVLDIDNTKFLDALIREKSVRIRMVYHLRNKIDIDARLKVVLGISASPAN